MDKADVCKTLDLHAAVVKHKLLSPFCDFMTHLGRFSHHRGAHLVTNAGLTKTNLTSEPLPSRGPQAAAFWLKVCSFGPHRHRPSATASGTCSRIQMGELLPLIEVNSTGMKSLVRTQNRVQYCHGHI